MEKWEKERLISLTKKAVMHAIYTQYYYAEDESQTLELLKKLEQEEEEKEKIDMNVITKAANDIWTIAENKADDSANSLKQISGVLHDIRAGHSTDWYMKKSGEKK